MFFKSGLNQLNNSLSTSSTSLKQIFGYESGPKRFVLAAFRPDKTDPETILLVPSRSLSLKLQLNQRHL